MDEDLLTTTADDSDVSVVINLEALIKQHLASIARLQEELTKYREMLDDILGNDATLKEHTEKAKEANKIKAATKAQLLKQPHAADTAEKVKSVRSQIKEQNEALSDYLREFQRLSGLDEIEGEDGELHQIVYVAKLRRKSAFRP